MSKRGHPLWKVRAVEEIDALTDDELLTDLLQYNRDACRDDADDVRDAFKAEYAEVVLRARLDDYGHQITQRDPRSLGHPEVLVFLKEKPT